MDGSFVGLGPDGGKGNERVVSSCSAERGEREAVASDNVPVANFHEI
jgi:hypothetical protein